MTVKTSAVVVWIVTPCSLEGVTIVLEDFGRLDCDAV
jgi:hypothetical protein